jgi:hypothetical protein
MHSFTELIDRSTHFILSTLKEAEEQTIEALQTSAATHLVKSLQMIQLQKVITAVGMFSIFEAILQDSLGCEDGFAAARQRLEGQPDLRIRFHQFSAAINVLKHGRGRSYDLLLAQREELPFRIKGPNEDFFSEGDVSEVSTLVEVDDKFVMGCASVISEVSRVISENHPEV